MKLPLLAILAAIAVPAHALVGASATPPGVLPHLGSVSDGTSGVLIAPNWVLTAGHAGAVGASFLSELGSALVAEKYTLPGTSLYNNDIGLLLLSTPIASPNGFPLLNQARITRESVNASAPLTMTLTSARPVPSAGTVSKVTVVDHWGEGSQQTNWLVTEGPVYMQNGDSGGGLFFGTPASSAVGVLLGIGSATFQVPELSAYIQTAPYRSWIDQTLYAATPLQNARWTTAISPVPEPATVVMMLLGTGLLLVHAGRRRPPPQREP